MSGRKLILNLQVFNLIMSFKFLLNVLKETRTSECRFKSLFYKTSTTVFLSSSKSEIWRKRMLSSD